MFWEIVKLQASGSESFDKPFMKLKIFLSFRLEQLRKRQMPKVFHENTKIHEDVKARRFFRK